MAQLNVMPCQINLHWLRNTFKNVPVKKAEAISLKYLSPTLCSAEKFLTILKLKDLPELELNTMSESRKHELYTGGDVNSIIFWIAKNNMKISQ